MHKLTALVAALLTSGALAFSGAAIAKDEPKKTAAPVAAAEKKAEPIDINTATEKELATLKGIGEVRAKAIVAGRPYRGKDELVDKKIIPESVYNDIKEQVIAKQAPAKKDAKPRK
jgi:DNA uptake protein ComE-like DNA-binding protein